MDEIEKSQLKTFLYWLADYPGWQEVKTNHLLADYEAYLEGKS